MKLIHCKSSVTAHSTSKYTMVERSSTSAVTYFGSYGSRPIDRALGAAVTLSVGVFLFQLLNRYIRRLNKDWEKDSWITALVTLILSRSVREVQPSSTDTAVHRGACHCRSVTFEVSSVNMFYSSLELSREFVAQRLTVIRNFLRLCITVPRSECNPSKGWSGEDTLPAYSHTCV
jgi:hypothetical protein